MLLWDELVIQLSQVPSLPGARCRGRAELFDATIHSRHGASPGDLDYARQAALRLCNACPALDNCRAWAATLPPDQRPLGVIAGQISSTTANTRRSNTR